MKLSKLIRDGIGLAEQGRGDYVFIDEDDEGIEQEVYACAVGHALLGAGTTKDDASNMSRTEACSFLRDILGYDIDEAINGVEIPTKEEAKIKGWMPTSLHDIIVSLVDVSLWNSSQVADWLESVSL